MAGKISLDELDQLREPFGKVECTAVTDRLYEMNKSGINAAVVQVKLEQEEIQEQQENFQKDLSEDVPQKDVGLLDLSAELVLLIASRLDPTALLRLGSTCSTMFLLCSCNSLWTRHFKASFLVAFPGQSVGVSAKVACRWLFMWKTLFRKLQCNRTTREKKLKKKKERLFSNVPFLPQRYWTQWLVLEETVPLPHVRMTAPEVTALWGVSAEALHDRAQGSAAASAVNVHALQISIEALFVSICQKKDYIYRENGRNKRRQKISQKIGQEKKRLLEELERYNQHADASPVDISSVVQKLSNKASQSMLWPWQEQNAGTEEPEGWVLVWKDLYSLAVQHHGSESSFFQFILNQQESNECTAVTDRLYEMNKLEQDGVILKKSKRDFQRLTLDTNTTNRYLSLSENNREVTYDGQDHSYPDHNDRFDSYRQVLCSESLTGRCYWEVEWTERVGIAVTYRGISRKGYGHHHICELGQNDKSWSLYCSNQHYYSVIHNREQTILPVSPSNVSTRRVNKWGRSVSGGRVAVYLDHPAGTLSFYEVSSDTLTHLYTLQTTFTEPLYAGFWVGRWEGDSVRLCEHRCSCLPYVMF